MFKEASAVLVWCIGHAVATVPSKYDRAHLLLSQSVPYLFPTGLGDPNLLREREVSFDDAFEHLMHYKDDRFAKHYRFRFVGNNISMRRKARSASTYFVNHILMQPLSLVMTSGHCSLQRILNLNSCCGKSARVARPFLVLGLFGPLSGRR